MPVPAPTLSMPPTMLPTPTPTHMPDEPSPSPTHVPDEPSPSPTTPADEAAAGAPTAASADEASADEASADETAADETIAPTPQPDNVVYVTQVEYVDVETVVYEKSKKSKRPNPWFIIILIVVLACTCICCCCLLWLLLLARRRREEEKTEQEEEKDDKGFADMPICQGVVVSPSEPVEHRSPPPAMIAPAVTGPGAGEFFLCCKVNGEEHTAGPRSPVSVEEDDPERYVV